MFTSFELGPALVDRLRLAVAMTRRRQKELVSTAIGEYLDRIGVPKEMPKLKEPGR